MGDTLCRCPLCKGSHWKQEALKYINDTMIDCSAGGGGGGGEATWFQIYADVRVVK